MKREDVVIEHEALFEFEITEDFSVLYSTLTDVWFIEDYSEDGKITILEDLKENIPMEDVFIYKESEITKEMLDRYKDIVSSAN